MQIVDQIPEIKPRLTDAHKGDFGKVCIIGGSWGMSGAAALAGRAALRAGSGLVRVAVPKCILPVVAAIEPCFTTIGLVEDDQGRISSRSLYTILDAVTDNDAIAFGPGVGISNAVRGILEALLKLEELALVIDADGLNNLSRVTEWPEDMKADVVLTPHPGEMKRLWQGLYREDAPIDRQQQAIEFADRSGCVVVLKGAGTVISDGQRVYVNTTGNPGMATAGSGDVLAGVITSLLGQGFGGFEAALLGVYVHGLAGDIAAEKIGQISLIATDIIDSLGAAFIQMQ